jgi:hypothetical protein
MWYRFIARQRQAAVIPVTAMLVRSTGRQAVSTQPNLCLLLTQNE